MRVKTISQEKGRVILVRTGNTWGNGKHLIVTEENVLKTQVFKVPNEMGTTNFREPN